MKVLLLTDGVYPYALGGMQKHSNNLARYLAREGCEVTLAHCVYGENVIPDNRTVAKELEVTAVVGFKFPDSIHLPGHYIFNSRKYSQLLYEHFKTDMASFDVIYAQGFTAWTMLKRRNQNVCTPVVLNLHGIEMYQPAFSFKERLEKSLLRIPAKSLIKNADFIQSLGGKLTARLNQLSHKSKVWECGIGIESSWYRDVNELQVHEGVLKFVFIGRHEARKGLHLLNPVLQRLSNAQQEFAIDFIGEIPAAMQLSGKEFTYHGKIMDENKIQNILDQCDVLLLTSLSEGMPTVVLEAMTRGLAVLATDVGAVAKLVSADNGQLIQPGNVKELEEGILSFCSMDADQLLKKKQHSIQKATPFKWDVIIKDYVAFLSSISG